ncbi:MAG TPA: SRPBCC family protein [Lysobacter sp.]|nr:SRPBCC family protein [Lysobacter sp.]
MTRLLEILISLAIVAVLFIVVGFILPSSRHLEHSVETNRKMPIVYDTLNSVRRFRDWNPSVAGDPAIKINLSGPETGVGAKVSWDSEVPALGQGSWTISATEPGKSVSYAIEDIDRGTNKRSQFTFAPTGKGGRNIQITQSYDVDYGMNLLGRFSGLYVSSNIGEKMKVGLGSLSNMLATIPNLDYTVLGKDDPSMAPRLMDRPGENLLVLNAAVPLNQITIQTQMKTNIEWIKKNIAANGLEPAGPVRIITNEYGSQIYSFDVAQPVRKAGTDGTAKLEDLKLANNVELLYNAPGRVAMVPFKGHMSNLQNVRDALRAWAMTRGYETIDRPYESWKNGIDAGFAVGQEGEYEVVWALK